MTTMAVSITAPTNQPTNQHTNTPRHSPEDAQGRLLDADALHPGQVQLPQAVVLRDGQGLQGGVEGPPRLGHLLHMHVCVDDKCACGLSLGLLLFPLKPPTYLLHGGQQGAVAQPDARHPGQVHQGATCIGGKVDGD